MAPPSDDELDATCSYCDGIGVLAEGQSCDLCGGTGYVLPPPPPLDPPDTPPPIDMFTGEPTTHQQPAVPSYARDGEGAVEVQGATVYASREPAKDTQQSEPIPKSEEAGDGSLIDERSGQLSLVDEDAGWKEEWKGMPEFTQKDLEPYKTVYVHFETRADMEAFAKLVGQRLTFQTRSIWYPPAEIGHFTNKRFIDENK